MNTTVGRRILGWRPGRNRPDPVPPCWNQWAAAACVAVAPHSGTSTPPGPVLMTAHKADLFGASARGPRS